MIRYTYRQGAEATREADMIAIFSYTEELFEDIRQAGALDAGYYRVGGQYGYSPDGVGVYWYDSREEMLANH